MHVIQDGEIYNYRELRAELERAGHRFRTQSDTEVVLHLYEEHGERFANRLRGMFALAIWDSTRRRLVLARDRFGIRPLVYRDGGGELTFASELRALPRGEVDLEALDSFLAVGLIPAPLTIFRDVRKLPPGHLLLWENGRVRLEPYGRPALAGPDELRDEDEAELVEELRSRLRDSVRAHLTGDVPVGVLLSGGIESGFLAALAAEEVSEPLNTFALRREARRVAERYSTRHRELLAPLDPAMLLPALAEASDEPLADSSALTTYLLSELAAGEVNVVLAADGGGILFGGGEETDLLEGQLAKVDRTSMAHSLEARLPYLDTVVTNLALALPPQQQKTLLRKAAAPLLPRQVGRSMERHDPMPVAAWLRGELEPFARETLSAEALRRQGFFPPEEIARLIDDHVAGREDHSHRLWRVLAFTLWHERHVERVPTGLQTPQVLVER